MSDNLAPGVWLACEKTATEAEEGYQKIVTFDHVA